MDTIEAGKHIMLRLPSDNFRIVKLQPGNSISLGKFGSFNVDDIIGKPFGYTYEIGENKRLSIIKSEYKVGDEDEEEVVELLPSEDNRELIDDPAVQGMDMADIEKLKKQGLTGQEIIDTLKSSHSAFDKKTAYSQAKYIKRKQQKFLQRFTPEQIGSSELIDIFLDKEPSKIQNISVESLALMLSMGNVQPGKTYLVVDDIYGVLTAALMERMGGEGLIVVAHENEHPNLNGLEYLNYTSQEREMIKSINWLDFISPEEYISIEEKSPEELQQMKPSARGQYYKKRQRQAEFLQIRELIDNSKFDAILTATDLNLATLLPHLIPAAAGSSPIVTYSEYKEKQVELAHVLQKDLHVIAPTVMETRVRKYQTLPGRMHPHMTSRGHGGYVLWGTRVFPARGIEAVGVNGRKKRKTDDTEADGSSGKDISGSLPSDVNDSAGKDSSEPSESVTTE